MSTNKNTQTAPATFELCPQAVQVAALLQRLCDVKKEIDALFEAQTEGPMFDMNVEYLEAEGALGNAIYKLGGYIGLITVDRLLEREAAN
jgi:hypothetical protein